MRPAAALTEARLRMARVPEGAELIRNEVSGAPGIRIGNIFILPGVPHIATMMLDALTGTLEGGRPLLSRTIGCWAAGERGRRSAAARPSARMTAARSAVIGFVNQKVERVAPVQRQVGDGFAHHHVAEYGIRSLNGFRRVLHFHGFAQCPHVQPDYERERRIHQHGIIRAHVAPEAGRFHLHGVHPGRNRDKCKDSREGSGLPQSQPGRSIGQRDVRARNRRPGGIRNRSRNLRSGSLREARTEQEK